jgi:hypothetical protein
MEAINVWAESLARDILETLKNQGRACQQIVAFALENGCAASVVTLASFRNPDSIPAMLWREAQDNEIAQWESLTS